MHHHGTPVLTVGLYGSFELRVEGGDWMTCRTAVVPAGVRYELNLHGQPLGEYYPEPNVASQFALTSLLTHADQRDAVLVSQANGINFMRDWYEDRGSHEWVSHALAELIECDARQRGRPSIDRRLAAVITHLQAHPDDLTSADDLARRHHLSASRFRHLFSEQVGVPYRRYRMWNRLRAAMRIALAGGTLTDAAMAVGFSDSAHFAHNFRDTFGVTPSYVVNRIARVG